MTQGVARSTYFFTSSDIWMMLANCGHLLNISTLKRIQVSYTVKEVASQQYGYTSYTIIAWQIILVEDLMKNFEIDLAFVVLNRLIFFFFFKGKGTVFEFKTIFVEIFHDTRWRLKPSSSLKQLKSDVLQTQTYSFAKINGYEGSEEQAERNMAYFVHESYKMVSSARSDTPTLLLYLFPSSFYSIKSDKAAGRHLQISPMSPHLSKALYNVTWNKQDWIISVSFIG